MICSVVTFLKRGEMLNFQCKKKLAKPQRRQVFRHRCGFKAHKASCMRIVSSEEVWRCSSQQVQMMITSDP